MSRIRLNANQIHAGVPLPFDTFDDNGRLLLRRGFVIESADQAERLIARGMYTMSGAAPAAGDSADPNTDPGNVLWSAGNAAPKQQRVSVHALLDETHRALAELLTAPPEDGCFAARLGDLARTIQRACDLDADAALSRALVVALTPYAVRHCLDCAIHVELLLRQTQPDVELRLSAVCAALTMNLAAMTLHEDCHRQQGAPGPEQLETLRAHPENSARQLEALGVRDRLWLDMVRQHHEATDGTGYPAGLKAADLRPESQFLAAVDRYCVGISPSATRPGKRPGVALQELLVDMGSKIDPRAASRLVREVGIHPPGTLVTLANGELAMVVARTLNPKQPVVRSLTDSNGKIRPDPAKRLTSDARFAIKGTPPHTAATPAIRIEAMWLPVVVEEAVAATQPH